jgi:hypothetical protein
MEGVHLVAAAIDVDDRLLRVAGRHDPAVGVDHGQVELAAELGVAIGIAADLPDEFPGWGELRHGVQLFVHDVQTIRPVDRQRVRHLELAVVHPEASHLTNEPSRRSEHLHSGVPAVGDVDLAVRADRELRVDVARIDEVLRNERELARPLSRFPPSTKELARW